MFDLPRELISKKMDTVRLISSFGTTTIYKHTSPFAYVIDREKFNTYFFKRALVCGAEIKLSHKVVETEITKEGVEVKVFNTNENIYERFKGKILILATGVKISLARKLGLGYPVNFLKGAQKTIKLNWDFVTIITGSSISRGGFAWIVPERDRLAKVGLIPEGNPRKGFETLLKTYFPYESGDGIEFKLLAQGPISTTFGERVISFSPQNLGLYEKIWKEKLEKLLGKFLRKQ